MSYYTRKSITQFTPTLISIVLCLLFIQSMRLIDESEAIGDVRYSILPPEKFYALHNPAGKVLWVLMDGRGINGSRLADLQPRISDARGMFIRSTDMGRFNEKKDGTGDPDGIKRNVVDFQMDEVGYHQHKIFVYTGNLGAGSRPGGQRGETREENVTEGPNSSHTETRPKNVALYLYIRIN